MNEKLMQESILKAVDALKEWCNGATTLGQMDAKMSDIFNRVYAEGQKEAKK